MIIPPLAGEYNKRFPTITHLYFDDHQAKREHALQLRLKQIAPTLLDGGRAILWYCHMCQKPWYEMGRIASLVCLSTTQLAEIAQQLGTEAYQVSAFPSAICPLCASLHLGGMPSIEEYLDGKGYRFSWEARTLRNTRLFCIVYRWNKSSISEVLREVSSAPSDVLTAPIEQVRSMVAWLKALTKPGEKEIVFLTENDMHNMNRVHTAAPGFAWCGYGWKSSYPFLGQVLVTLGITFPDSSICSVGLLVACWRQIAQEMEKVLVC